MRTQPGSAIGFAAGDWEAPRDGLGIKLAKPDATVLQMVGDGGFYFGNPSSAYAVSKQYKLPIFTVLFDNSGWSAVKEATLRVYPEGDAKATNEFNALLAPESSSPRSAKPPAATAKGWTIPRPCPLRSSAA